MKTKLRTAALVSAVITAAAWGGAVAVRAQVPAEESTQDPNFQPPMEIPVGNSEGDIVGYSNYADIYAPPSVVLIDEQGELMSPSSAMVYD